MEKSITGKEYYKKSKVFLLLLAHDSIFLLLLAHDIIPRGSIRLKRSIIKQTSIIGGEMYCQSIKCYDSSHCIIQRKYYFPIKYYYSNKYYSNKRYYSNKYYEN